MCWKFSIDDFPVWLVCMYDRTRCLDVYVWQDSVFRRGCVARSARQSGYRCDWLTGWKCIYGAYKTSTQNLACVQRHIHSAHKCLFHFVLGGHFFSHACTGPNSPWYYRTGWLGVKHQLAYLLTYRPQHTGLHPFIPSYVLYIKPFTAMRSLENDP